MLLYDSNVCLNGCFGRNDSGEDDGDGFDQYRDSLDPFILVSVGYFL